MIGREGVEVGDHHKKRVLIVEDDFYIRSLYTLELEYAGFKVLEADNASQARNILASEEINFIILDIMLPGERGSGFLEWLKKEERYRLIPVVMLTNVGDEETTKRCLAMGALAYLLKSRVTPKEVAGKVTELYKVAGSEAKS